MKIHKVNPWHWLWLVLLTLNTLLAVVLRRFIASDNRVVLYAHKLNGNLGAIYRESLKYDELSLTYLTMDYSYYRQLKSEGVSVVWAGSPQGLILLVKAKALISDHGLHSLVLLLDYSSLKFIDVWHGIPFKGFDKSDFKVQHRYDEIWVASNFMADLYENKFGFKREKLKAVGYARTDVLINPGAICRNELMREYDFPVADKKIVLYAPTWKQDDTARSLYPFGMVEAEFLHALSQMAEEQNCLFLIRMHLNATSEHRERFDNVYTVPADKYPDTERLLLLSDILIYDWSSIAFDFLLLDRPTIYLDVPPPFRKGFSLDGSYRYGEAATDLAGFKLAIANAVETSEAGRLSVDERRKMIKTIVYESYADGSSSDRACKELFRIV
ncbi:CDP-glycerol glycerophosphotransferase family protein [Zhongshania aquimaris]|uniref:CDP-glycerol glycerophosphotransferase family protein n=1 Tax=Zhongshania aquimaris TaxID=2857107 RepID=A0ABS6VPE5_9GAMM|nr:CDP-glycerol glycerophosphotransferase family protein [Zhongshania aquimaris]MBW2940190.1 CDP-glycerol glycerophosphotransferase family protein [Zhongshania aquimaris]